jgi:hypothetical protein
VVRLGGFDRSGKGGMLDVIVEEVLFELRKGVEYIFDIYTEESRLDTLVS